MTLSIITSLYRSENHLPQYIEHVQRVFRQITYEVELIIIANEATSTEQDLLQQLSQAAGLNVQIIYTPRETLYHSWNRGIAASSGSVIGFWNVDDTRTAEGLTAAHEVISAGVDLVDMAYERVEGNQRKLIPAPYQRESVSPKTGVSPFFMFHRKLVDQAGAFNPHFQIAGDYEWSKREAVRKARYRALDVLSGQFVLHTHNLSGGRNRLEWVEFNTVLLWLGDCEHLRPVDPVLMRENWETWGQQGHVRIPDEIEEWLWGAGSRERFQRYTRERNAHPFLRRLRLSLARRGIIKSAEFDAHQRWKGNSHEAHNS